MNEYFNNDRAAAESAIVKEINALVKKYQFIKALKVDVSLNITQTKAGNFIIPSVSIRVEA